jgi:heterodisulfide reductase subunit A
LKPVVVVGGGISGIQASLILANRGIEVHLVEKAPYIGGVMAQLDKTFPTMNCCICILEPKMVECYRHPKITVHTLSEVTKVDGSEGNFRVKITERPRFVDVSSCTRCGACVEKCPVTAPDEFQAGFGSRKAIYIPFPQAVPYAPTLDRGNCLHFNGGDCTACEKACPTGAIRYEQEPKTVSLNASSIILATGFEQYNPKEMGEYGYRRYANVITPLEIERLLSPYGPTGGELTRPSDGKVANRIAFIQCVGSRSHRPGIGVPYCSGICCMYAAKEAVTIKEKYPDSEVTVFYIDIKAFGKDYQSLIDKARKEMGVRYVRGKPGEVRENPSTKDLEILYEDTEAGEVGRKEVDLAILSAALLPRKENAALANVAGVKLDEYGFFKVRDPFLGSLETTRDGIYVCGCSHGPRDVSGSLVEAYAAAIRASSDTRLKGKEER